MYTFKIGNEVRILHLRHQFQRDYDQTFTEEIFIVSDRVVSQDIPIYKLKDIMSEPIQCIFLCQRTLKVIQTRIEKVIRKHGKFVEDRKY